MENKKTPETLKPEQMESGKWYVINARFDRIIKFDKIVGSIIFKEKSYRIDTDSRYGKGPFTHVLRINSIRPATKEEVLKYFPDEVFEPIELRPEDLKAGEVYTLVNEELGKFTFKYNAMWEGSLNYELLYCFMDETICHNSLLRYEKTDKIYHATPEEKKLLLGEEQTDWEAKYNELKVKYDDLKQAATESNLELKEKYNELNAKYDALSDRYTKLEAYNDELTERINQYEIKNNQEKVYFYYDSVVHRLLITSNLQEAKINSEEKQPIYEAYCIGKKKSVLVSE